MAILEKLKKSFRVFEKKETDEFFVPTTGMSSSIRPDRPRFSGGNARSIANAVYNRIALDVASVDIEHVKLDEKKRYSKTIDSGLNNCLTLEANIDQTARAFIQDVVISMIDEGVVAVVPVDTDTSSIYANSYEILTMRTGRIVEWKPQHVRINLYNDRTGNREDIVLPKRSVAIIENPMYSVMNAPNSTMQRLIRKLALLDQVDEQSGSGKLDLIIQLPYLIRSDAKQKQADKRKQQLEEQLSNSKFGIAYTDATEHITQLNRPVENNLMKQVEYLTTLLFSQLGITENILNGSANEDEMRNYYIRTIDPILNSISLEMERKFLSKTARSQGQAIRYYRDPFRLAPIANVADIGDKFIRNEIMTANEVRQVIGMKPSDNPSADQLKNPNMPADVDPAMMEQPEEEEVSDDEIQGYQEDYDNSNAELDDLDNQLDELEDELAQSALLYDKGDLKHYASPYYDPVKAHEYYEKTKKLKGRVKLNGEGRATAKQVKEQINAERKAKIKAHQEQTNASIKSQREGVQGQIKSASAKLRQQLQNERNRMRNEVAQHTQQTQSAIDGLRRQLEGMSPYQKKFHRGRIQQEIAKLREKNGAQKSSLQDAYNKMSDSMREKNRGETESLRTGLRTGMETLRNEHKQFREKTKAEYDQKIEDEMAKINAEKKFQEAPKAKKGKAKKKKA